MNRILFKKEGRAKYISHLDLMRTMQRVFVRAGVEIKHTAGFNPHPYMAFALPLSVGTESDCELMDFELTGNISFDDIPALLNKTLPEGITAVKAYDSQRKFKELKWLDVECRLTYDGGMPDGSIERLNALFGGDELVIEKRTKRGTANTDVLPMINRIKISEDNGQIVISARISAQEPSLSPSHLISAIEQKIPDLAPDFSTMKRLEVLDSEFEIFR